MAIQFTEIPDPVYPGGGGGAAGNGNGGAAGSATVQTPGNLQNPPAPFGLIPNEPHGMGYEVRAYRRDGKRRALPTGIGECHWTADGKGGYQDFSLSLEINPGDTLALVPGDRIEIWNLGNRQYRGIVSDLTRRRIRTTDRDRDGLWACV